MKHVYSAADFPLTEDLSTGPCRLAVIGHPVKHSASPQMHQPALTAAGLNISYVRVDSEPGNVAQDLDQLRDAGFLGVNCTVPHKFEALDYCDELTDDARLLGAVNTIHFTPDKAIGHNTDGPGFINAIADSFGKKLGDLRVFIAGAGGGAGKAIATQCAREGSPRIVLVNRSVDKLHALQADIERLHPNRADITCLALDSTELVTAARDCDLIINTTSLGLKESDPSPLPAEVFHADHCVYDSIYSPPRTQLLKDAEAAGARIDNGFSLLLHQGALSFQMWTGISPDLSVMRRGLNDD